MSLISAIREFFLGPPLQFHHQKTILETIYTQLNNPRFAYLIIIVSIISFLAMVIRLMRIRKQTGILPFVVCAILIYSGYCLERSFRVGVEMNAENLMKNILGTGIRKSTLMENFLEFNRKSPSQFTLHPSAQEFDDDQIENRNERHIKPEEPSKNDAPKPAKFLLIPKEKDHKTALSENQFDETKPTKIKFDEPEKKEIITEVQTRAPHVLNKMNLTQNVSNETNDEDIPDPTKPTLEDSASMIGDETQAKEKKAVFNETFEQEDFLETLKRIVSRRENAIAKSKNLLSEFKKIGTYTREDLKLFEENFNQFLKNSNTYKKILLKADISPDLYKIDLSDLKHEVNGRLEIISILESFLRVSRNGKSSILDKMKAAFIPGSSLKDTEDINNLAQIADQERNAQFIENVPQKQDVEGNFPFNNFLLPQNNRVYLTEKNKESSPNDTKKEKDTQKEKKSEFDSQEIENLTFIQAFMVIQGIICLIIFILMVCNLLNIIPACKLILLVILIGNVFIGIVSMIYAQALAKKCIIMDVPNCQNRNLFDVEEVVDILNEREEPNTENAVNFIEKKFKDNYDELTMFVEKLETFMEGNETRAIHKIDIFRNMINKLMFIESDFEPTSKFFSPVYAMKRYLDDLQHQMLSISNKSLFPIYRELFEAQIYFEEQKENIGSRIENFLKLNMKRKEDKANNDCKKEMKKICKAKKDYEQLALALIVFGLVFVVLVCF